MCVQKAARIVLVLAVSALLVCSCAAPKNEPAGSVSISIEGALEAQQVELYENDTVFDVLKRVTSEKKIQTEFSGVGAGVYVEGINNLYEFDRGPESGWVYTVNDERIGVGAGVCKLKSGDSIKWIYTEDSKWIG